MAAEQLADIFVKQLEKMMDDIRNEKRKEEFVRRVTGEIPFPMFQEPPGFVETPSFRPGDKLTEPIKLTEEIKEITEDEVTEEDREAAKDVVFSGVEDSETAGRVADLKQKIVIPKGKNRPITRVS